MKKRAEWPLWTRPVLLALPFLAGMGALILWKGTAIRNLIHVAIKLVVIQ